MTVEQRLEQLERKTNRLRIAVVVLAAALCGVVSMAATESTVSRFDTVAADSIVAKKIYVQNEKGKLAVSLGADDNGGDIYVWNKTGEGIVTLGADDYGNGEIGVWNRKGKGRKYTSQ
jgi:hypothetical protein